MVRIALGVEYDGSDFNGFESQPQGRTVQPQLEIAVARVADEPVRNVCAGRTDSGVHATGQVVHFDTEAVRPQRAWVLGVSSELPRDIVVRWACQVDETFNARFTAFRREYRYIIDNRPMRPAILSRRVAWQCQPLDAELMQHGARFLLGEHDFSAFRASGCQARHPVRTIELLEVRRLGDFIFIDVAANAFLQHMVRNIVGTLMMVGLGRKPVDWVRSVLAGANRRAAGPAARADGLYLCSVHYPPDYALPTGRRPEILV